MDGDVPSASFAMGSSQINLDKAIDPGLIYDIRPEEYISHLTSVQPGVDT